MVTLTECQVNEQNLSAVACILAAVSCFVQTAWWSSRACVCLWAATVYLCSFCGVIKTTYPTEWTSLLSFYELSCVFCSSSLSTLHTTLTRKRLFKNMETQNIQRNLATSPVTPEPASHYPSFTLFPSNERTESLSVQKWKNDQSWSLLLFQCSTGVHSLTPACLYSYAVRLSVIGHSSCQSLWR